MQINEEAPFREHIPVIFDLSQEVRLRGEDGSSWSTSSLHGKIIGQRAVGNDYWIQLDLIEDPYHPDWVPPVGTLWINSRFTVACRERPDIA